MNKGNNNSSSISGDKQKIVDLFQMVSSIPYGNVGQRSLDSVLKEKRASCSGKHILLGRLLEIIGVEVRYFIGETDLSFLNDYLPKDFAIEKPTLDFHNFIKISTHRRWLTVDATFGPYEARLGFPTNVGWDARCDCSVLFPSINVREVKDIEIAKKQVLSKIPSDILLKRKSAFEKLVGYLDSAAVTS